MEAADRLCETCVVVLDIDAAAISIVFDGASSGTLGASGELARRCDELQFILGEGPCLDSVAQRIPILVVDLADPEEARWPAYGPAMLANQIRGVHAIPVVVAGEFVGALDLFRARPGPLPGDELTGAVVAAELAGVPLLDLLDADLQAAVADPLTHIACVAILQEHPPTRSTVVPQLRSALTGRVVVEQAKGLLRQMLDVPVEDAFKLLRAYARANGEHLTDVARRLMTDRYSRLLIVAELDEMRAGPR